MEGHHDVTGQHVWLVLHLYNGLWGHPFEIHFFVYLNFFIPTRLFLVQVFFGGWGGLTCDLMSIFTLFPWLMRTVLAPCAAAVRNPRCSASVLDVPRSPGSGLAVGTSSVCSPRTHKQFPCSRCNYQLTSFKVYSGTMWFIVKFHYNFAES